MTKKVRIENADLSIHQLIVETWAKGVDGNPDTLVNSERLLNPTDIMDGYVWAEQYIIIREVTDE